MGMETTESFGAALRRARLAAGLTQEALAERAGVSTRNIPALERGENRPRRDTAERLAGALDLDPLVRERFLAAATPAPRRRRSAGSDPAGHAQPIWRPGATRTNVPLHLTSFVGREDEMVEIAHLLARTRLLTLTGAGGVGKTRLALQTAATLLDRYAQGTWVVELAHVTGAALVPTAITTALGIREDPTRSPLDVLVRALRDKHLLLILDNCEHLLDACARVAETLLRACAGLHILATSRETLAIPGEVAWRVPSLVLPDAARGATLETLLRSAAIRLFVERATATQPRFVLTAANSAAVTQICLRLDGIPLALELAAARVRGLGVEAIAARLDQRFLLLTGGSRTALPRQQTLKGAVDWSYDLLTEPESLLFDRLAVFAGGFTLEAVETICTGGNVTGDALFDLLARLVDKSLVVAEDDDAGVVRYRLLETLRQYAVERLDVRGEAPATHRRHAACYLALAEQIESTLYLPDDVALLDRLETELDNLRAILSWSLGATTVPPPGSTTVIDTTVREMGVRLAGALNAFWWRRGHRREGLRWLEQALTGDSGTATASRAKALLVAANMGWGEGDRATATARFMESIALYREMEDRRGLATALGYFGSYMRGMWSREHDETSDEEGYGHGTALVEEGLALAREVGDPSLTATILAMLAYSAELRQDEERARARTAAEESLLFSRHVGALFNHAGAQRVLGRIAMYETDFARAAAAFAAETTAFRALGDSAGIALGLSNLGDAARKQGDVARAAELYEESLAIYRGLDDDRDLMAHVLRHQGDVALAQGDLALARLRYAESCEVAYAAGATRQGAAAATALAALRSRA